MIGRRQRARRHGNPQRHTRGELRQQRRRPRQGPGSLAPRLAIRLDRAQPTRGNDAERGCKQHQEDIRGNHWGCAKGNGKGAENTGTRGGQNPASWHLARSV